MKSEICLWGGVWNSYNIFYTVKGPLFPWFLLHVLDHIIHRWKNSNVPLPNYVGIFFSIFNAMSFTIAVNGYDDLYVYISNYKMLFWKCRANDMNTLLRRWSVITIISIIQHCLQLWQQVWVNWSNILFAFICCWQHDTQHFYFTGNLTKYIHCVMISVYSNWNVYDILTNKSYIKSKCIEVYVWGVSHFSLAKLVNCNQILGHVADQDYIQFID